MNRLAFLSLSLFLLLGCMRAPVVLPTAVSVAELPATEETAPTETTVVEEVSEPETAVPPTSTAHPTNQPINQPTPLPLPGRELFAFTAGEPGWFTVDDDVMGGVSSSTVTLLKPNILYFSGTMSLENNGGFSSVRSNWQLVDLSDVDGVLLRVLGDGQNYRLRLRTDSAGREISYNALFNTTAGEWQIVFVPFAEMIPTYRGFVMDVGSLDASTVGSFGLMLSDKQPGQFALQVDWIRAVSEEELAVFATNATN